MAFIHVLPAASNRRHQLSAVGVATLLNPRLSSTKARKLRDAAKGSSLSFATRSNNSFWLTTLTLNDVAAVTPFACCVCDPVGFVQWTCCTSCEFGTRCV